MKSLQQGSILNKLSCMTSTDPIEKALNNVGPARTGRLVDVLSQSLNISPEAARQRLSRARTPIERYPGHLLPKREAFFYLRSQRNTERYWDNLLRDLRERGSIYACAIDGLDARGGIVPVDELAVVSGAPIALKKQVPAEGVARKLVDLGVMRKEQIGSLGRCFVANSGAVSPPLGINQIRARRVAEGVMLDGLREWARKNGIGSYNKIAIRGESQPLMVGQFKWDLTGPSYLFPLRRVRRSAIQPGFIVADVFAEGQLDVPHIQYFIRKAQLYHKTSNSGVLFPILMATSFTGDALTKGHKAGLMLTTPATLFGRRIAEALADLVSTLKNAAAIAAVDGERLYKLLNRLSEIEGRAGNMRGILFELIAAHLAKRHIGGSIDFGILHTHRRTGKMADLDVVCVTNQNTVHVIECKGKSPGGTVSLGEVTRWLRKLPIMQDYVASREHLRERDQTYEFWTTGRFNLDALEKLEFEQKNRTKRKIAWEDGKAVRKIAAKLRLKPIGKALDEHFVKHPLAELSAAGG